MRIQNINQNNIVKNKQKLGKKNQTSFSSSIDNDASQKNNEVHFKNPVPDANLVAIIQESEPQSEQKQIIKKTIEKAENILDELNEIKIQILKQNNKQNTITKLFELEKIIEEIKNHTFIDLQLKNIIEEINIRLKVEIAKQKWRIE